ncbi:MAG: RNA polymerase sigma factor [Terriglobales bacterium]
MAVRRPAARKPHGEASGLPPGDDRLLVEAAQKDPSHFAELYELNFARVYGYIARRVGDRDAAQDLTSDVFHKALANLQSFEWRGVPFAGWLLRIAANMIADRSKRGSKEITGQDGLADLPDQDARPRLEEADECARLFLLVDQLPQDQRRVIGMRFAEEKSIREIAQALGRTEGAVKQLQFRALQNLRARMEGANA